MKRALSVIFLVLLLDQALKCYIKTHFYLGEEVHVLGNWFILHFTENPGMAFGMELGGDLGKIALSLFRIVVAGIGAVYLMKLIRDKVHPGLIVCASMILAGAIGNILDSIFYGKIFSDSMNSLATFMPANGGYAAWLHGRVVDMFYFPMIQTHIPSWFPFWKNEEFVFFRPVFNVADASITLGISFIMLFQRRFFPNTEEGQTMDLEGKASSTASDSKAA